MMHLPNFTTASKHNTYVMTLGIVTQRRTVMSGFRLLRTKRDSTQIRCWLHDRGANALRGETQ